MHREGVDAIALSNRSPNDAVGDRKCVDASVGDDVAAYIARYLRDAAVA